jgi:hypothetical protein
LIETAGSDGRPPGTIRIGTGVFWERKATQYDRVVTALLHMR